MSVGSAEVGTLPVAAAHESRVEIIDALRGLAAVSVAWFHFTLSYVNLSPASALKLSGKFGYLGVEVFFVISGFVIPFALYRAGFRLRYDWMRFLAKRFVRIEPPYIISIALFIVLAYLSALSPAFRGSDPDLSLRRIALHVAYLISFHGDLDWFQPVYWSLAIEFQYYLLAAFVFPLVASTNVLVRVSAMAALLCTAVLFPDKRYVFAWLGLFAMGIACFQHQMLRTSTLEFLAMLVAGALASFAVHSLLIAATVSVTAFVINFWRWRVPWLTKLGVISYSLYLLHVPIGGRVVNLGGRADLGVAYDVAVLLGALLVSVAAAWMFYILIERPFVRLGAGIRYR